MRIFASIALLLKAALAFSSGEGKDYYALDAEEFFKLAEVNTSIDADNPNLALLQAAVFFASNEARKDYRKTLFTHDSSPEEAAAYQAAYLHKIERLDHNNRARGMRKIMDRISHFGGDFAAVAENLEKIHLLELGTDNMYFRNRQGQAVDKEGKPLRELTYAEAARKAIKNWMQSEGHRDNLLGNYSHLGVGSSKIKWSDDGIPQVYLVQNFGNKKL